MTVPYWVVSSSGVLGNYHQDADSAIVEAEGLGGWVAYTGNSDREASQRIISSRPRSELETMDFSESNEEPPPGFDEWDIPGFNGR